MEELGFGKILGAGTVIRVSRGDTGSACGVKIIVVVGAV